MRAKEIPIMRPCLVLFILALCALPSHAARWEVNQRHPKASDDNPGTADKPFKTIARAARAVTPGDTVRIQTGVYRESVLVEASGTPDRPITFEPAPGAQVVLTGSDLLTDWTKEPGTDGVFSTSWPHRFIGWNRPHFTHPGDDYHRMIGRAEQLFVLGYPYLQVLERAQLGRGAFFVDLEAKRLYVSPRDGRDLTKRGVMVEGATRGEIWHSKGAYLRVRGLRFRYAANPAQKGAALFSGAHGLVEDCVFEHTNGGGATFTGTDITVRRCRFEDNGEIGFGGSFAHRLHMEDCVVRANNAKGFSRDWEAGGMKLCMCRGVIIEHCQFLENRGNGIWFDIGNEDCTVRGCLIEGNEEAGIFYEISYGLKAQDNVIIGNGLADYPGGWGASSGIALSSSPGCVIERNLLVGNKEGFNFREQDRTTRLIEDRAERPVWNHDQTVRHNVIAYNRDAQTWGWFDTRDGRHWPAAMQAQVAETGRARDDIAANYLAKDKKTAPPGLDLAKLKITMADNLYAAAPGQALFNWGVGWKKHKQYATLDEARRDLSLEEGSRQAQLDFADPPSHDFRLPAGSPALTMDCYPRTTVPGVTLGTR